MNFLLVRSPGIADIQFGSSKSLFPPLGLQYLAASLEENGHGVEIIDFAREKFSKQRLKKSLLLADVVGISIYSIDLEYVKHTSKIIKELSPDIPLIIGGPHCIFVQGKALEDISNADICVTGEGENTIIDIAKSIQGKKKLSDVPGIFYREKNEIKHGQDIEIIQDLDSLAFPARHLTEKYDDVKKEHSTIFKSRYTAIMTSRGCPFKCSFCSRYGNVVKNYGFRKRSAESVVKEILQIDEKYDILLVVDDNFIEDKKRAHKIMDKLIEYETKIHLYIMGARVTSTEKELYKKMKKANVKYIGYGLESGSQDVLDFYNKKITLDQSRKAVQLANKMGFITSATFIIGSPIETKDHIEKTIKFACSLPLDIAYFRVFYYTLNSPLWLEAVENKKISQDEQAVLADSNRNLGNFNKDELYEYWRKANKRFYLRPNYISYQIYKAIRMRNFMLLKNGLNFINYFKK